MVRGAAGVLHPAVAEGELARLACTVRTSPSPCTCTCTSLVTTVTCVRGAVDTGHRGGGGAGGRSGGGGRGRGGGRSLARVAWSLFVIIHSNNLNIYFNLMHDDNMTMIKIGMINFIVSCNILCEVSSNLYTKSMS